ncbi:glycerol kinase GlpK [Butyrivibrio sp. MC2013]|uniref:glycerol kinase GlpK n=1 Tax=Butyrivibrio sp. MC2013 TaxID=1280686 RepID=UPI00042968A1|nr:glycerol kinase GlpK [Butyrivibrio sp. MC2013]
MTGGSYVMALDQGTTSSRCILFDKEGFIVSMAQKEFNQYYPQPGWVEHNPREIWSSQLAVAIEAMANVGATADNIAAIGITNQRETTIVWDRETGEPIYNAIVWQCRRTADQIEELKKEGWDSLIKDRTGLVPDAYFSATKIRWILDNVDGAKVMAREGRLAFGNVDSWLIWNLTKGKIHVTDYTNASRTMLFDIHRCQWDEELLSLFKIPISMMPEVKPSSCIYGDSDPSVLGGPIMIGGAAGDQQAALFGQNCFEPGQVKNTYGTGGFLLMNTGSDAIRSEHGLVTTIAASLGPRPEYALEGSVFVAGASIQWLRDEMRMLKSSAASEEYADMVADTAGVYVVPAFTGMGAPYWDPYARGTIVGLSRGCRKEHFVRATLESICYQSADVIKAMEEDAACPLKELRVDGGASANNFLMQFQSDICGVTAYRPKCIETTALGAAYLAGIATGYWKDKEDVERNWQLGRKFEARMDEAKRAELLKGWHRAVRAAIAWSEDI